MTLSTPWAKPDETREAVDRRKSWLVVVLTHDEGMALIETCFGSIRSAIEQLHRHDPAIPVRVCVVDDEPDAGETQVQELCAQLGFDYRAATGTITQKRNIGIGHTPSDFVAFTDADCQVDPNWLVAHSEVYRRCPTTPGIVGITVFEGFVSPTLEAARSCGLLVGFTFPELMDHAMWGPCSNLSFRAEALAAVGGFDERFGNASEDVDVGLRVMSSSGQPLLCLRDAPVHHDARRFVAGAYRRAFRWGVGEATLLCHHPERHVLGAAPDWVMWLVSFLLGWTLAAQFRSPGPLIWFAVVYGVAGPALKARATGTRLTIGWRAQLLQALFSVGTFAGLVRQRRPALVFQMMNYGSGQYAHEWPAASRRIWEMTMFLVGAACLAS